MTYNISSDNNARYNQPSKFMFISSVLIHYHKTIINNWYQWKGNLPQVNNQLHHRLLQLQEYHALYHTCMNYTTDHSISEMKSPNFRVRKNSQPHTDNKVFIILIIESLDNNFYVHACVCNFSRISHLIILTTHQTDTYEVILSTFHISLSIHWFCTTFHMSIKPFTSKSLKPVLRYFVKLHCVSKNGPTLKQYSSKL